MNRSQFLGWVLVSGLLLVEPAGAAPAGPGTLPVARPVLSGSSGTASKPAPKPIAAPASKPAPKPVGAPAPRPGVAPPGVKPQEAAPLVVVEPPSRVPATFEPALDLKRIAVGNQAGLLKIFERVTGKEAYFRTLDDRNSAFFTAEQRQALFAALALAPDEVEPAARVVMINYAKLPKREALAFLGAVGSSPDLPPAFQETLQRYLVERYETEKDNLLRRQALLSLALMHRVDAQTVEKVLVVFETEGNLWVTFPVQMFFEKHSGLIKALAHVDSIRTRARAVPSLYTPNVLQFLEGAAPAAGGTTPAPTAPAAGETTPAPTAPAAGETTPAPTAPAAGETTPAPTAPVAPGAGGPSMPPTGAASP